MRSRALVSQVLGLTPPPAGLGQFLPLVGVLPTAKLAFLDWKPLPSDSSRLQAPAHLVQAAIVPLSCPALDPVPVHGAQTLGILSLNLSVEYAPGSLYKKLHARHTGVLGHLAYM